MSSNNCSRFARASVVTVAVVVSVFVSWRTMHEEISTVLGPPSLVLKLWKATVS